MNIVKMSTMMFAVAVMQLFDAQNVALTEVKQMSENKDTFLYQVSSDQSNKTYLGTLEVQGYSNNDPEVFKMIYEKSKKIGANAFSLFPFRSVDGQVVEFNPANYRLQLFYVEQDQLPKEDNCMYVMNTTAKSKKVRYNNIDIVVPPRTYFKRILDPDKVYTLSTRKFLGSSVQLKAKENQPVQFFQIESARIKANPYGASGINIKSGDISGLEKSYAEFLKTIYKEVE